MANTNRIIEVKLTLDADSRWLVEVTKEFAPEYGGGTQTFQDGGTGSLHRALEIAREMVTVSPARRVDDRDKIFGYRVLSGI